MAYNKQIENDQRTIRSSQKIFSRLREMVRSHIDIINAASRLGVMPSTIKKILAGGPISPFIEKKIAPILEEKKEAAPPPKKQNVDRFLEVYRLYQEKGTLQAVGEEIGLCRERIRQLLKKGMEFGLFEYAPAAKRGFEVNIPREKILTDYGRLHTLKGVAQENNVSLFCLDQLIKSHRITERELKRRLDAALKQSCIERYGAAVRSLGHHPTTTELQRIGSTRYLYAQIRKLWGSIDLFRRECGVTTSLVFKTECR